MTTAEIATAPTKVGPWSCPGSQLILKADAPREEWLAARKAGLGGSDAAALMGDNHYDDGTPYFVWLDKTSPTDVEEEGRRTKAMERGQRMEPIVRDKFEEQTGLKTRRQGLHRSREYPTLLASVDALVEDGGGLEAKTATSMSVKLWPADWKEGVCPPLYAWQAKHYMLVTGRRHWYVAALIIDTWELVIWKIEWDEDELELLAVVETEFWRTYIEPGVEPEPDLSIMTMAEVSARFPSVTASVLNLTPEDPRAQQIRDNIVKRRVLHAEIKEAEEEKDRTAMNLKLICEGYEEVQIDGRKAFTNKASKTSRLNADVIAENYPEVDLSLCKKTTHGRSLYVDTKIFK